MALMNTPICEFGLAAPDFDLPGTDGRRWTLADCRGPAATLVMFICNHCPYVRAIQQRLVRDTAELRELGIWSVAIMSNDAANYPDDSFDNMRAVAERLKYPFPYLLDESQQVARAYGAVCTPDFFGYNAELKLQYRGRLDAVTPSQQPQPDTARELVNAMRRIAATGQGPAQQVPSMGCSIKWKVTSDK
jgi:peroxiredoxin